MVRTSLSLSASTTKWYPSVSPAAVWGTVAVSSVETVVVMVGGPSGAVMAVCLHLPRSASRTVASKTCCRPADKRWLSNQAGRPAAAESGRRGPARRSFTCEPSGAEHISAGSQTGTDGREVQHTAEPRVPGITPPDVRFGWASPRYDDPSAAA